MSNKEIRYPEIGVDENGDAYFHMFDENGETILTIDKDGMKDKNGELMQKSNETNNGWISVEDELPEAGKAVLVYRTFGKIDIAWYSDVSEIWFSNVDGMDYYRVSYWMPLPKPPKET